MKILFIEIETKSKWAHASMGPACIAAYIRADGHSAALLRVGPEKSARDVIPDIQGHSPDIVGFSITTRQWKKATRVAREVRNTLGIPTIAGGLHAMFAPESILESNSFDYLCIGEGEAALSELLTILQSGEAPLSPEICNIWEKGGRRPDIRPPLAPLDSLPFAARDLLAELGGVAHIGTLRGCPFPCTFCAAGALDNLYEGRQYIRRRSVGNVICELIKIREAGPLHYVIFLDDTFTFNRQWVADFCNAFGREIGVGFSINARAETLDRDLIKLLAKTGCRHIVFGVESGSRRVREEILNRPGSDRKFIDVFKWAGQAGMLATANYMIGIPGETAEEIEQTLALNSKLAPDDFGCFVFYPHPGTPLFKICREKGYLPKDYLDHPVDYSRSILNLPGLTGTEIDNYYAEFTRVRENIYRNRRRRDAGQLPASS